MPQSKIIIISLNLLKALAIVGVIAIHFCNPVPVPNAVVARIAGIVGPACPQLFFIISAFLLFNSIGKFDFREHSGVTGFFKAKFSRILPLYFIMVAVYSVLNISTPPYRANYLIIC